MRFYAAHGCYDTEQRVGGRFSVNLEVHYDGQNAAQTDDVTDAINYLTLYDIVREQMLIPSHILEHVTQKIVKTIMDRFDQITLVAIEVSKLSPPLGGDIEAVSVTLTSCR